MVIQGPSHPARNFRAWLSRIPEVAVNVDVVILDASRHLHCTGRAGSQNIGKRTKRPGTAGGLGETAQGTWVLLRREDRGRNLVPQPCGSGKPCGLSKGRALP